MVWPYRYIITKTLIKTIKTQKILTVGVTANVLFEKIISLNTQ